MSDYQPGEIVDITIKGARVAEHGAFLIVRIPAPDGTPSDPFPTEVPIGWSDRVTVERVAPVEWPPQVGDVWRDRHGSPWFAVDVHDTDETDDPEIVMVLAYEAVRRTPEGFNQIGGPVTLVHREPVDAEIVDEQDGGQQS